MSRLAALAAFVLLAACGVDGEPERPQMSEISRSIFLASVGSASCNCCNSLVAWSL